MRLSVLDIFSLLRRAAARVGEIGGLFSFLDVLGVTPGFLRAMSDRSTEVGAVFTLVCLSALYDLLELATRPDMTLRACGDDEPELPMR